jgi:hypothetical protein
VIGLTDFLQIVNTSKDYALTVLHTSQITITPAHIKPSQFAMLSPIVAW